MNNASQFWKKVIKAITKKNEVSIVLKSQKISNNHFCNKCFYRSRITDSDVARGSTPMDDTGSFGGFLTKRMDVGHHIVSTFSLL